MNERIKALYDAANAAHVQAKGILSEYAGKDMPADKKSQIDQLLDEVDAKVTEAKSLEKQAERMAESEKFFNEPVSRKSFFQDKEQKDAKGGPDATMGRKAAFTKWAYEGAQALSPAEFKDLSVGIPTAGGYLTVDTWLGELIALAPAMSAMRRLARVLPPVAAGSVVTPAVDTAMSDATWTTEILTGAADAVSPFGERRLTPHPLAKRVLVSNDLLRTPGFDAEAWIRGEMAERFAVPEEAAYFNGNGAGKPLGLLQTAGLPTYTGATQTALYGDDIINWRYSLPAKYEANARIACNRAFLRKVRTMSKPNSAGAFDNYIWQPGLSAGAPSTILDVPYEVSDQIDDGLSAADAWEANSLPAIIGDFRYYWVVDAQGMNIQRIVELYSGTNQIGFHGRKASDGMCVRSEAFVALKIKA